MKKQLLFLSLLTIFGLILFTACQEPKTEDVDNVTTSLTFETEDIALDGKGGTYTLAYTIANGIEGIDIATECDAEWIKNIRTEQSKLIFEYERNLGNEERVATIMVTYPNVKRIMLKVKQHLNDSVTFEMEVSATTTTSCTTKITPSNSEAIYIVYMAEIDYLLGANITNAEELFRDDYGYFMAYAEQANAKNLKEFFLDYNIAYQGETSIDWTGMMPGCEYVLYVYAIEFNEENTDYSLASPVSYEMLHLEGAERSTVDFDVNIEVNGPKANYKINPTNWDGKYYLTIYEEGDYMYRDANNPADESYGDLIADVWLGMINDLVLSGYTVHQLLELMCIEGPIEYSETLKASTNYAMVLYAVAMVDNIPQVVSEPVIVNFTTEEIGMSDMTIDIKVENKYVRVADITITPSSDDPYTAAVLTTSDIPTGLTNDEIISWLNNNLWMEEFQGEIFSHINTFQPETQYTVLAYGYYGGVVTTELFRYDFTTDAASECENSVIRVDFNGPYSLKELETYDSDNYYSYGMFEDMGWYAMWSEIHTETPSQDMFHCVYSANEFAIYGEEVIFQDLVSYSCNKSQLLTGQNNTLYVMCGVTMDYRGNYSEMWVSEPFMFEYNASTKRPLSELIEKIYNTPAPSAATTAQRSAEKQDIINHLAKRR